MKSFFYVSSKGNQECVPDFKSYMIDSGSFSFVYGSKAKVNMSEYFDRYKSYIKENDVDLFFELDIDDLVGYDKVLSYRRELENYTGKQCIPVWHISRGKEEWLRMCDEYAYVAIGGMAGKSGVGRLDKYIPWFTKTAHERGAKVHGLGCTKLGKLDEYGFDSVDSAAWLYGNIGAYIYYFNGSKMQKMPVPKGKRMNSRKVARNNFMAWVKFAEYMEGK